MDNINRTDVGERIKDTKKEIAILSEELEVLLESNVALNNINFGRGDSLAEIVNTTKSDKIKNKDSSIGAMKLNIESGKRKSDISYKTAVLTKSKPKIKSELTCIKKSNNKEVTREFMRQQREKREELRKKNDSKNKIDQELKKHKLLELQQKSLALVQRNLQLKSERSKFRDRRQQLRIDNSNYLSSSRNSTSKKTSTDPITIMGSKETIDLLEKSNKVSTKVHETNSTTLNDDKLRSLGFKTLFPTTSRNKNLSHTGRDIAARKIQTYYRDYRARKQLQTRRNQMENQNNGCAMKESKETQTHHLDKINFPKWLQPPTIDPYPCNFINTIKKKLQMVVSSPLICKDVGIQSSIIEAKPKVQQLFENNDNIGKNNLRSAETVDSHLQKESNLDADALQHFALIQFNEKYSPNLGERFKNDSESDTSKNIPDISTESGLLLDEKVIRSTDKNHEVLSINTDLIRNLTLRKQSKEDVSNDNKNTSKGTFNFSKEENGTKKRNACSEKIQHEELHSKKYINSSKNSITSYNLSNDSETPSIVNQTSKQLRQSISSEEIKTEKSRVSSEKENSRRRLLFSPKESILLAEKVDNICHSNKSSSENIASSQCNPRTSSNQVWNLLKINSSHTSSPSSKQSIKSINSFETSNIELRLPNFRSSDKNDEESQKNDNIFEVIKMNSVCSTIASFSLKLSKPGTIVDSFVVKSENDNSNSEMNIESLPKSIKTNTVRTTPHAVDESFTDSSDAHFAKVTSKISEFNPDKYYEESNNDRIAMSPLDQAFNQNIAKKSEPRNSSISSPGTSDYETNVHLMRDAKSRLQSKDDTNEIHVKFEAEILLLNDFNESLKQFMAVEKAFESLKSKNETSLRNSNTFATPTIFADDKMSSNRSQNVYSTINISRGSDLDESFRVDESFLPHMKSSNHLKISSVKKSALEPDIVSFNDDIQNSLAGLSLKMFEQFIKYEDIRIDNLRTIIKIREQALLDRTKGELAWLEIQRKHLKETGKLHEASLVKKKQRGILLKHQQERREMQRLKQLQKIQSNERKTSLKEQKNLIKAKLTSEKLLSEMKIQTPRKQRPSGPMRVLKANESLSETSLSRRTSDADEILSITSKNMSTKISEKDSSKELVLKQEEVDIKSHGDVGDIDKMKRALLVRQESLMKRRKAVEDLLRRHQKLLEEEKKIKELEKTANAIIMQLPCTPSKSVMNKEPRIKRHLREMNFKGMPIVKNEPLNGKYLPDEEHQENLLQHKEKQISSKQYSFDTSCKNAKTSIDNSKTHTNQNNEIENLKNQNGTSIDYSEDFESEKPFPETESTENNLSSISNLIEDFTQIEHGISMFNKQFNEDKEDSPRTLENLSTKFLLSQGNQNVFKKSSSPCEKSESSINDTGKIKSDSDTLNSTIQEEIYITQKKESPTSSSSTSENKYFISEQIAGSEERVSNEDIPELLLPKSQSEVSISAGHISQEQSLHRIPTLTYEIKGKHMNILSSDENTSKETLSGELISVSYSAPYSISEIKDEEIIGPKPMPFFIADIDPSLKYLESNSELNNDISIIEDRSTSIPTEAKNYIRNKSSYSNSSDEGCHFSTINIRRENGECDVSVSHEKTSESTLGNSISQKLSECNEIETDIFSQSNQPCEKTTPLNNSEETISRTSKDYSELKPDGTASKDNSELDNISEPVWRKDCNESRNIVDIVTNAQQTICTDSSNEKQIENRCEEKESSNISHEISLNYVMNGVMESSRVSEITNEDNSIILELTFSESSEEKEDKKKFPNECRIIPTSEDSEKSYQDKRFSNNYTDYFNENKEDTSLIQNPSYSGDKSILDSTLKMEVTQKLAYGDENEVMVKIDSTMYPPSETKIVVIKDISNVKPDQNKQQTGVQQRVSEILAKTVGMHKSSRDKNLCSLDYYVTAYEDITPVNSPESGSLMKSNQLTSIHTFNNEAEELMKKQLAIEMEIKHLEQQQKEQLPLVYMRAIPNKPPPPYTPPSVQFNSISIWPTCAMDVKEICRYSAKVLYNAYLSNSLKTVTFSESHFNTINDIKSSKQCCSFVFDLCREIAENHYEQFRTKKEPSWFKLPNETGLFLGQPFTYHQLENYIHNEVRQLLGFKKINMRENSIIRWAKKRKDHVDEILVLECQAEEQNWMNYDSDELTVKNAVANAIFESLLTETIEIYKDICC